MVVIEEVERQGDEGLEEVVEFVLVAEVGEDFAADGRDGGRVKVGGGGVSVGVQYAGGNASAERGGAGAAFFGAGLVEVGVGVGVEEFVGELRGHGRVDGEAADGAVFDAAEDFDEALEIHGLLQGRPS